MARNRFVIMEELRRLLPEMAGSRPAAVPFGLAVIDRHLPAGGLACGALHEVMPQAGAMPAACGFVAALLARFLSAPPEGGRTASEASRRGVRGRLVFVTPAYGHAEYGRLYGHGLHNLGLDPARLILVETAYRRDTLWTLEEALRSGAPAAVAGSIDKLDLKSSQRLHLAAMDAGLPLLLLRPPAPFQPREWVEASAAATRWRVGAAEAARDRFGLLARARWRLALERCRNGRPGEWVVEYDHVAHRFSLAAALADPAHARGAEKKQKVRQAHCA